MDRRRLLSTIGTATAALGTASTAGCLGSLGAAPDDSASGPTTTGRPTRVPSGDGYVVDLGMADVQASVLVMGVHTDIRAYNGSSFLRPPVVLRNDVGEAVTDTDRYEKPQEASSVRLDAGAHAQVVYDRAHEGPGVVLALAVPIGDYGDGEEVRGDVDVTFTAPPGSDEATIRLEGASTRCSGRSRCRASSRVLRG